MIAIFTNNNSSRLQYIAGHIFRNILGGDFFITDQIEVFLYHQDICINYSNENLGKGILIKPQGLLEQNGITNIHIKETSTWNDLFCFFPTGGSIPFDIFAASFYLITRYEEYNSGHLDKHFRYDPSFSLLYKNSCLELPLIDKWAYQLLTVFREKGYDTSQFKLRNYNAISTFDIDLPFMFRNKGFVLNTLGAFKNLLRGEFRILKTRIATVLHFTEDPYFKTLQWIDEFQCSTDRPYYLFCLLGKYGGYDRITIYPLRRYYKYLRSLKNVRIGTHPSYRASFDKNQISKEKRKLEKIIKVNVISNRQHYLRFQIPETYRHLDELGYKEEYSMIYSSFPGFRAGTSIPFYFFDLEKNNCTSLLIRPTIVMDAALISHLRLTPDEGLKRIKQLADNCKLVGGDFTMLWHNSNISGNRQENPWIDIFINGSQYAISLENDNFAKDN